MSTTISDLTEPIHAVLERIPVHEVIERIPLQEVLDRMPQEVRDRLPESLQPEKKGRSKLWLMLLVLVGVGAGVALMRRRRGGSGEMEELDLREVPGEVSFADGVNPADLRPTV